MHSSGWVTPYHLGIVIARPRSGVHEPEGTMSQQWRFEQDENSEWHWVHVEGDKAEKSASGFPDQLRCMMDAMRFVVQRHRNDNPTVDQADSTAQPH
jgi:hypothetical protein